MLDPIPLALQQDALSFLVPGCRGAVLSSEIRLWLRLRRLRALARTGRQDKHNERADTNTRAEEAF